MATKRKFKTKAFESIHSSASAMYEVGAIDKTTMRSFDVSCLTTPPPLKPRQIRKLRKSLRVTQPVFARYLNTGESTIEKWETGAKQPSGMALRLLAVVQKHGLGALVYLVLAREAFYWPCHRAVNTHFRSLAILLAWLGSTRRDATSTVSGDGAHAASGRLDFGCGIDPATRQNH